MGAQGGLGLGEPGMHADGEPRTQGGRQEPQRLGGAVRRDDLVGGPAVPRSEGRRRRAVVGVAARVVFERVEQRLAQPPRRPARDDVDRVVGVAWSHVAVTVTSQVLEIGRCAVGSSGGQRERPSGNHQLDAVGRRREALRGLPEQIQPCA